MRHETAVVASVGLAAVLVVALGLAAYFAWLSAKHRAQAVHWQETAVAQDTALVALLSQGLEAVVGSLQRPQSASAEFVVPACLAGSGFVENLRVLGERYVADLHQVRGVTAASTRQQVEAEARESAKAAVKAFATAMVSTGINVSSEVAQALRRHHGSAVFATLTKIDHGVQQMLHQAQSYVVLAGGLLGQRWPASTLTDVVGAAQGAIPDYARVHPYASERAVIARMVGPVKLILSHLLDNAARYSPPQTHVEVNAQHGHHGITLLIDDAGKRMSEEELKRARRILDGRQEVDILTLEAHPRVGFPVIALLARRYGMKVVLTDSNRYGGMCASVFLPEALLTTAAAELEPAPRPARVAAPAPSSPALTENGLPTRTSRQPVHAQQQASAGRRTSTEPARPAVIGAWQQANRQARGTAAPPQDRAGDTDVHPDQQERPLDS
ncbi:ATP-binding protein [Streptomyces europaeiscabiei]|uniref:ATP-binding protein n=1 Tax=Streptomyces europaeiscabiei TaxID=146819 RepID=UPI000B1D3231|nr:ATP-binding protein [Streptomyces europaeiscabiei]